MDFDHMVRLGWLSSPQSIEVRFGTSRAGAADVDIALYTAASVDAVVPAHPELPIPDNALCATASFHGRSPITADLPESAAPTPLVADVVTGDW
ncbi:hypothetical protein [Streptomyces mirabilis]|uniref:hypothetical protein n=1 Tax=Streptomyces mirabilis TaxID=68239 RepID=UPI0036799D87